MDQLPSLTPAVELENSTVRPEQRTQIEITALFNHWKADPCFDLESTDGFEAYREQLTGMRREYEERCAREARQRLMNKSIAIGIPGNLTLTAYIQSMEERLGQLEQLAVS